MLAEIRKGRTENSVSIWIDETMRLRKRTQGGGGDGLTFGTIGFWSHCLDRGKMGGKIPELPFLSLSQRERGLPDKDTGCSTTSF